MPRFDRADGEFIAWAGKDLTYEERVHFKNAGWNYDYEQKCWYTTDYEAALKLRRFAIGAAREHINNTEAMLEAAVEASWAEDHDADFPCPQDKRYLPFQKAGIAYAIERPNTLIADPPGLGKTIQAIGVNNVTKPKHVLIVCPASLKINWKREWERWDVQCLTVGIAESISKSKTINGLKKSWTEHVWPETDVVIINYDMLEVFDQQIKSKKWDMTIFDECHMLKSADAVRTKCVFGGNIPARKDRTGAIIKKAVYYEKLKSERKLFLTGTPVLSRPVELWNLILACDPKGLGRSYDTYVERYCGAEWGLFGRDTRGSSNEEELQTILRSRFMVRRDKRAVLSELPDKTRETIILPHDRLRPAIKKEKTRVETALAAYESVLGIEQSDNTFWYITAMERLAESLDVSGSEDWEREWETAIRKLNAPEALLFGELSAAREEVALAKVDMVSEHVAKLVDSGEPVILFAYHTSVVNELKKALEKAGLSVGIIVGSTPLKKRQQVVDDFQAGKLDVVLGNILAMGVGWTLTAARFVVFAEIDWVPAMMEQAEDRAWRIGQDNAVLAQYLLVDGSIEAVMAMRILEKMEVIKAVLDN